MTIERLSYEIAREWIADGREIAVATLVETEGSSPLDVGAMMFIDADDNIEGSVTGGCVEGDLAQEARRVLAGEEPRVRVYGISDDEAAGVGLMCGGTVHIFVERLTEQSKRTLDQYLAAVIEGRPGALATLVDGDHAGTRLYVTSGHVEGQLGGGHGLLNKTVTRETQGMLERGITGVRRYGDDGAAMGSDLRVFVHSFGEPPRMVIIGAIDFSVATSAFARKLGYRVTIVDPREPFIRSKRFTEHAEAVVQWPDEYLASQKLRERDVVLVFSHDPKLDEPALIAALESGAGYIGALGSRRTQAKRMERLREAGTDQDDIGRISAPCGLDLGARTPAETAVSVLAEVVAVSNGRAGDSLSDSDAPIHTRESALPGV